MMVPRGHYAPALRALVEDLHARRLAEPLCLRRATLQEVAALAGIGLVTSSAIHVGEDIWCLRLSRLGQALRRLLLAELARA